MYSIYSDSVALVSQRRMDLAPRPNEEILKRASYFVRMREMLQSDWLIVTRAISYTRTLDRSVRLSVEGGFLIEYCLQS
jgi:hypothetical protein